MHECTRHFCDLFHYLLPTVPTVPNRISPAYERLLGERERGHGAAEFLDSVALLILMMGGAFELLGAMCVMRLLELLLPT